MDYQNRAGSRFGGGGMATKSEAERQRQQRLKTLALETINIDADPYHQKTSTGAVECRLCQTMHQSISNYLAHTQGKRHQMNLTRRDQQSRKIHPSTAATTTNKQTGPKIEVKKFVAIGKPGYKVTKIRDPVSKQTGMLFQIKYPEIGTGVVPLHRFMSTYEQNKEPYDPNFRYLVIAAEPYETIAFKIEAKEVDNDENKFWTYFDQDTKEFFLQLLFK